MRQTRNCSPTNAKWNCKNTQIILQGKQKFLKTGKTCEAVLKQEINIFLSAIKDADVKRIIV